MSDIIIRKANDEDDLDIAEVLLDFYNMKNIEEASNVFHAEQSKDHKYILAVEKNKIIGIVTWILHGLPKHGLFELDRICLLTESRGKGVGRILVNALINDAKSYYENLGEKIRKLYLLTHEENKSAHSFYEKVGFTHEVTLKNHYYDGKDERVYSIFFKI